MKKCLCFLVIVTLTGFTSDTQTEFEEYDLKAACIYNFTKFIDWNSSIKGNEFIIGILDSSHIYGPLAEIAKTKMVEDKKIIIRQFSKLEDINTCHILFISGDTSIPLKDILKKASVKGTLTISEKAEYAKQETAINFIEVNGTLKFEVNRTAINSAGLTASSQLLGLAIIVK